MGTYYEGGAVIAHRARLLIACGGRGGREHPPLTHIQSNACRFLFLLFSYLRFAEVASFDKKELRRSGTESMMYDNQSYFNRHTQNLRTKCIFRAKYVNLCMTGSAYKYMLVLTCTMYMGHGCSASVCAMLLQGNVKKNVFYTLWQSRIDKLIS